MDRLRDEPVFVVPRQASMPGMITHSDIKALVFSVLYNPLVFPVIARFLDELYREREIGGLISPADLAPLCAPELKLPTYPTDGGLAVLCSDQHWIVSLFPWRISQSMVGRMDKLIGSRSTIRSLGWRIF